MAFLAGAGNPAGSGGTAGTGKGLNYIGDHAYAYSGVIQDNGTGAANATLLDFTTGGTYIVAELNLITDVLINSQRYIDIEFSGESIFKGAWDSSEPMKNLQPLVGLLIPPYTRVVIKWGSSTNQLATLTLVGRAYQ